MKKLLKWVSDWNKNKQNHDGKQPTQKEAANEFGAWAKSVLISGPPGIGKTTSTVLVCKELGIDLIQVNASNTRSKKQLRETVSAMLNTTSMVSMLGKGKVTSKRALLMDEVDSMDRGGITELINLINNSHSEKFPSASLIRLSTPLPL